MNITSKQMVKKATKDPVKDKSVGNASNVKRLKEMKRKEVKIKEPNISNAKGGVVRAEFCEEDEIVNMELEGDDFLSEEETREIETEEEDEGEVMYESDEDHEVSFANSRSESRMNQDGKNASNSANGSHGKEGTNEELSEEEEQSMMKFAMFLEKRGYLQKDPKSVQEKSRGKEQLKKSKTDKTKSDKGKNDAGQSMSELTIYHEAVPMEIAGINETNSQRLSSSSEDANNTSDENLNESDEMVKGNNDKLLKSNEMKEVTQRSFVTDPKLGDVVMYQKFLDCRLKEQREMIRRRDDQNTRQQQAQLGTSKEGGTQDRQTADERAKFMICQAEGAKARMYDITGNEHNDQNPLFHSVVVDEDYAIIGVHLDDNLRKKIIQGEFVDFSKLIPKDKIVTEADRRLEIVTKNGQTFFQPITERERVDISSLYRWDQAFRIFSAIYNEVHPHRATELLQCSHIIHHAAQIFVWDNVYAYDIDFRLHLSRHTEHSWGIILQQAWSMRLQDRLYKQNQIGNNNVSLVTNTSSNQVANFKKKICWPYQVGECHFGFSCKFEHRCRICCKLGHGGHICRKLTKNSGKGGYHQDHGKRHNHHKSEYKLDQRENNQNNFKEGNK